MRFAPGDVVYVDYTPVQVGKVVEVLPPVKLNDEGGVQHRVRVRWLRRAPKVRASALYRYLPTWRDDEVISANESIVSVDILSNYARLVEDHERKAKRHRAVLEQVEAL